MMKRIKGLEEYVQWSVYRQALGLPEDHEEQYELLAQGEYNINYFFVHPITRKRLILRLNTASQMHLENQIEYEHQTLKFLENSGHTPKVYYCDGSKQKLMYGVLVMEFLDGKSLDYTKDVQAGLRILSDIHAIKVPENTHLLRPKSGPEAMLLECRNMFIQYRKSSLCEKKIQSRVEKMLDTMGERIKAVKMISPYLCCINTELNNTNFLINPQGQNSLIDWEKPLYADPAQDIGHYLAPTTSFWKTDIIFDFLQIEEYIEHYIEEVNGRFDCTGLRERIMTYIPLNCMRGLTWCAMAWVEYHQPNRAIFNVDTYEKLSEYLSDSFLSKIEELLLY